MAEIINISGMKDTAGALASLIDGESDGEGERKDKGETERGQDKGT